MSKGNSSYTLWSPQDTVRDVAESLGLDGVSDEVLKALAMDVEYRIYEIIEQAVKFKRHSRRDVLTTDDVAHAFRVLNVEPLYGYTDGSAAERDVTFRRVGTAGGQQVYYLDEEELDFDKLINEPLPQVPRLPSFSVHWLAVEGVQPAIAENPTITEIRVSQPPIVRGAIVSALNSNSLQTSATQASSSTSALSIVDEKSQKLTSVKPGHAVDIKPLVKHVLSKELQIYFNKVTSALLSSSLDDNAQHMKNAALTSLKTDSGLHQLVPYLIQFIAEQITHNLSSLELLTTILEMVYSILSNQSIFLDPYIHSLMPSILTLLLAKKLGGTPVQTSGEEYKKYLESTIALRDFAASLLDYVLKKFPQAHKSLKPRITRTLLKTFLDSNRVFGTYYGCLRGFSILESESIRFFLGNLRNWANVVFDESGVTLETVQEHKCPKFTEEETQYLIDVVIRALLVLKQDVPEIYEGKEGEVTQQEKQKLVDRCGVTIAYGVLIRDDAKEIISAIFLGE